MSAKVREGEGGGVGVLVGTATTEGVKVGIAVVVGKIVEVGGISLTAGVVVGL
jgi:hypothetical protein